MTPADLETLLREAEEHDRKTTPGPWRHENNFGHLEIMTASGTRRGNHWNAVAGHYGIDAPDAAFIAWSRSAVPKLVAAIRDLQARADAQESLAAALRRERDALAGDANAARRDELLEAAEEYDRG